MLPVKGSPQGVMNAYFEAVFDGAGILGISDLFELTFVRNIFDTPLRFLYIFWPLVYKYFLEGSNS